jgi:hypothetical protein
MDQYIDKCYDLVGLTEIKRGSNEPSVILWDAQIEGYAPRSKNVILTLRQKTSGPCTVEH